MTNCWIDIAVLRRDLNAPPLYTSGVYTQRITTSQVSRDNALNESQQAEPPSYNSIIKYTRAPNPPSTQTVVIENETNENKDNEQNSTPTTIQNPAPNEIANETQPNPNSTAVTTTETTQVAP